MHNLILDWFVTPVESSEVRVCSYSLSDVMPMAILLYVPEPAKLSRHGPGRKRPRTKTIRQFTFTPRVRDIVFLGTGLSIGITFVHRCLMISGK